MIHARLLSDCWQLVNKADMAWVGCCRLGNNSLKFWEMFLSLGRSVKVIDPQKAIFSQFLQEFRAGEADLVEKCPERVRAAVL